MANPSDNSDDKHHDLFSSDVEDDVIAVEPDEAASSDLDDGDNDVGPGLDSEDGIFAHPGSSGKRGGVSGVFLGTFALLALASGGGYLAIKNPDLVDQIKSNFSEMAADSKVAAELSSPVLPSVIGGSDVPKELAGVPQPDVIANKTDGAASTATSVAAVPAVVPAPAPLAPAGASTAAEGASATMSGDAAKAPEESKSTSAVPSGGDASASGAVTTEKSPEKVSEKAPEKVDGVSGKSSEKTAEKPSEKSGAETAAAVPSVKPPVDVKGDGLKGGAVKPEAVVAAGSIAPPSDDALKKPDAAPVAAKPEPITGGGSGGSSAGETKMKEVRLPDGSTVQVKVDDGAKTVYYDSPAGKALKDIPAPHLDVKRGNGESIIVVKGVAPHKKGAGVSSRSSSFSSSSSSAGDAITTTSLDAQVQAANRALALGRLDAANDMFDDLYRQNPKDPSILIGRAVTLQKLGQSDAAADVYEELLTVQPGNVDAVVNLTGLIRKTHPAVALNKLLDLREKLPRNSVVLAQLGVAYADSGNYEDAYRALGEASRLDPDNAQHYFNMAVIAEKMASPQKAIELYEKALEVDAVHGSGRSVPRDTIYDRLARLRGN